MAKLTRRGFIRQTSAGVAATGMLVAAPQLVASTEPAADTAITASEPSLAALTEPMLAHVRDATTGEVSLLVGTREIIFRDTELVMRLLKASV